MELSKRAETKGPLIVWLFFTLYFALLSVSSGASSGGELPQELTMQLILNLLIAMTRSYGVLLFFLVIFLAFWEKRRSLKEIVSSMGLRKTGLVKSVLWSLALFPLFIIIGYVSMMLTVLLGPVSSTGSGSTQFPTWYLWYMVIHSFFPVAVVEEAWARGYMLDRLMSQHPSGIVKALPPILLSSFLFAVWHLPSYLSAQAFPVSVAIGLLAGNVFPISIVLGIAYVRARTRNIAGPILIHFLLDAMPIILMLI